MAEPILTFVYNHSNIDTPYDYWAGNANWREIEPGVDKVIFTGGGIDDFLEGVSNTALDTLASGTRSPTIRPAVTSFVIPYVFVESDSLMYRVPEAGHNNNIYVFGVLVSGTIQGNCYLEAWDDYSFSTFSTEVLAGTAESSYESYVSAVNTVAAAAGNGGLMYYPWDGATTNAAFLRGDTSRVGLARVTAPSINNDVLYFNVYIRLETDSPTFHNTPVFGFRYLYT
jgi:hypothetical protein